MLAPTIDSAAANAAAQPRNTDLGQKDIFLKLLVAQMQFQDPLKPQDPTKMSSQLAQFNMVEQQTNTNDLLEQLVANGSAQPASPGNAASYLGHTATIASDRLNYGGAGVPFILDLPASATDVSIQIVDATGIPVRTIQPGPLSAGQNALTWDGLDDSGIAVAPGEYQAIVQASDVSGQPMNIDMLQQGIVQAVQFTDSEPMFVIAGNAVPQSAIQEIKL